MSPLWIVIKIIILWSPNSQPHIGSYVPNVLAQFDSRYGQICKWKWKMFRLCACACALMRVEFVVSFPFQPVIAELLDKFRIWLRKRPKNRITIWYSSWTESITFYEWQAMPKVIGVFWSFSVNFEGSIRKPKISPNYAPIMITHQEQRNRRSGWVSRRYMRIKSTSYIRLRTYDLNAFYLPLWPIF